MSGERAEQIDSSKSHNGDKQQKAMDRAYSSTSVRTTSLRSSDRTTTIEQLFPQIAFHSNALAEDDDDDEINEQEIEYRRKWEESFFAVGYTRPTWSDEEAFCCHCCSDRSAENHPNKQPGYVACTALCCGCLPVGRVGNMVVLRQRMVERGEEEKPSDCCETNTSSDELLRPQLLCVVGPYFYVTLLATLPFLLGLSGFTLCVGVLGNEDLHFGVIVGWAFVTSFMFLSLLKVSCSDPGILYRHRTPPRQRPPDESTEPQDNVWWWNDQAQSYRPPTARFDPESQCIIEDFDHVCPWVGTAIGQGNVFWFRWFIASLGITVMFDLMLLALSFG
mmetsp:Transcript_15829/g.43646  ORF Transcript_15829/g.43646 Transcript_15829/m.43646 type:complete len:334 (+) Transcript_15829:192-1193(+)